MDTLNRFSVCDNPEEIPWDTIILSLPCQTIECAVNPFLKKHEKTHIVNSKSTFR